MARPEFGSPTPFQPEIKYADESLHPVRVAENTSNILKMYFGGKLEDFIPGKNYLRDYTLKFVDAARDGLASHPERVDRLGLISLEDLLQVLAVDRPSDLPPDQKLQALDYSFLTMGAMPDNSQIPFTDFWGNKGALRFSRKGMLRPPFTVAGVQERLHELRVETLKIATGVTLPNANFIDNPPLCRTALFFHVAKAIPLSEAA